MPSVSFFYKTKRRFNSYVSSKFKDIIYKEAYFYHFFKSTRVQHTKSYSVTYRFTIHTIEDLRKELNRRSNLAADQVLRPNSPEELLHGHVNYPPSTPGRDTSTPLIFSPGGWNPMTEEYTNKKAPVSNIL